MVIFCRTVNEGERRLLKSWEKRFYSENLFVCQTDKVIQNIGAMDEFEKIPEEDQTDDTVFTAKRYDVCPVLPIG